MEEKFMLLPFDTKYAISNKGNLINVRNSKKLKTRINKHGYEEVQLSTNCKRRTYRIHRLVAISFIDNKDNKPYINHIDGNKLNNSIENLEWVTAKENDTHARGNGFKVQNKPIKAISMDGQDVLIFESLSECVRYFNTNTGSIHRVLKGKRNYHKNYKFMYL